MYVSFKSCVILQDDEEFLTMLRNDGVIMQDDEELDNMLMNDDSELISSRINTAKRGRNQYQ